MKVTMEAYTYYTIRYGGGVTLNDAGIQYHFSTREEAKDFAEKTLCEDVKFFVIKNTLVSESVLTGEGKA